MDPRPSAASLFSRILESNSEVPDAKGVDAHRAAADSRREVLPGWRNGRRLGLKINQQKNSGLLNLSSTLRGLAFSKIFHAKPIVVVTGLRPFHDHFFDRAPQTGHSGHSAGFDFGQPVMNLGSAARVAEWYTLRT